MSPRARHIAAALVAALAAAPAPAPGGQDAPAPPAPVTVAVEVSPQRVTIGEAFRYTMRVRASKDVELVVPIASGRIGDFDIVDFGDSPPREEDGRVVVERWYELVGYETGERLVRGPAPQYRTAGSDLVSATVPDAVVTVASLLPEHPDAADLRDIVGPVPVPVDWRPLRWLAGMLATLVALAALLVRLRRRKVRTSPTPPPHQWALRQIDSLAAADLVGRGRTEEFYVRLSAAVRGYVERRFGIRAPEMTTEEFLAAAHRDPRLPSRYRPVLQAFLSEADLVKFARHQPGPDDAARALAAARAFVTETAGPPPEADRVAA